MPAPPTQLTDVPVRFALNRQKKQGGCPAFSRTSEDLLLVFLFVFLGFFFLLDFFALGGVDGGHGAKREHRGKDSCKQFAHLVSYLEVVDKKNGLLSTTATMKGPR
jgi:hypothetical protein